MGDGSASRNEFCPRGKTHLALRAKMLEHPKPFDALLFQAKGCDVARGVTRSQGVKSFALGFRQMFEWTEGWRRLFNAEVEMVVEGWLVHHD